MKKISATRALVLGFGVSLLTVACTNDAAESTTAVVEMADKVDTRPMEVQKMEKTLGVNEMKQAAGVSYDLNLIFGGTPRFVGKITQTTDMDKILLEQQESTEVFDGDMVHVATTGELNTKSARFNALTWPYFFSLPFKLDDPGTKLEAIENQTVGDVVYRRAKLTFAAGTGDAPDDWYILYFDAEDRLAGAAYIVTFGGKSAEEAVANAHAIQYHDYEQKDGVLFSRKWTFHNWNEESGWTDQIGEAEVSNIEVLAELPADQFAIPEGAIAAGAPQG